jgi:uncharacterized protein YdeI (YjbR/CyaY-like superfamily)
VADRPRVHVADRAAWRAWLTEHAATSTGIWLVHDKGPGRRLSYDDIVEEALCFGWVDSLPRALDRVEDGVEPDDLAAALDAVPTARREWDAFPRSVRPRPPRAAAATSRAAPPGERGQAG